MKKLLVASSSQEILGVVKNASLSYSNYLEPIFCPETDEALSFVDYELPEIKILDFTSTDIDCYAILEAIRSDPWLHNGGIIAIAESPSAAQKIEDLKDPNILIVQTIYTFKQNFDGLLRSLIRNQQFLFNRGMQDRMGSEEIVQFVCDNNPMDIRLYTAFLVNYLYCTNRIDEDGRFALQSTLMELLTNALEHGNCGISYEEKSEWLNNGGIILDLIDHKLRQPEFADRKIHIDYTIGKDKSSFTIKDDGEGFDWKSRLSADDTPGLEEAHGRGIALSKSLVSGLRYNEKGNEVSFDIQNIVNVSNTVPGIMIPFKAVEYKKFDIICRQNEPSNDLYFIVSGRYGVYANRKLISVLTPKDMFIGEMAFLLNDRRSATIVAAEDGKLIRIPKTQFLNLIRKNPHYGLFLSKLLAQRLVRQNKRIIKCTSELLQLKAAQNK